MERVKASELAQFRLQQWERQGRKCALTGQPLPFQHAVVDHCHKTGEIRGVLARGANSMLGKIENHRKMASLTDPADLARVLQNVVRYLHAAEYTGAAYPTYKTEDEKRLARNAKRAKARRAKES